MTIGKFFQNVLQHIEAEFGIISAELKNILIPDGLLVGEGLLKAANSTVGEIVLSEFINSTLLANIEQYITKAITALTEAEDILSKPTPAEQLTEFAKWLQTLTGDSKDAFVIKFVQIVVRIADGNKLPDNIYDALVQNAVTSSKLKTSTEQLA